MGQKHNKNQNGAKRKSELGKNTIKIKMGQKHRMGQNANQIWAKT
jgi:hypothetical protein